MTLVSAPAGFGKTTLVGAWINETKQPVAWVSLDEGDNDPALFWSYFIAALQRIENDLGKNARAMLQSLQPAPITSIITNLINEIAAFPEPFSLVLDDYQVIHARSIHDALFYFIDHMPAQMHMVLISRIDPSLPLARLRARNQLHEIRFEDLRFTIEEAGEFLTSVTEMDLSPDDIAALESRTEGWAVGLQLAAQSLRGSKDVKSFIQAFTESTRYLIDYLIEEVFNQRPKGTLDFLLETSILDRLCAPLCDAISKKTNSQETLILLERTNMFLLPLDESNQWYSYHQLFADVLRKRLKQSRPHLIPELHHRAAEWFERSNLMTEAIQHALAANDFALAARIIEKIAPTMIVSGQIRTALGWLESLPNELMLSSPNLCLIHSAALMFTNQLEAAEGRLLDGERYLGPPSGEEIAQHRIIRGKLAIMRANLARIHGNLEECIAHAHRSLELLPETETFWRASPQVHSASAYLLDGDVGPARDEQVAATYLPARASGNLFTLLRSITNLARFRATQGRLHQAALTYQKVLEEAPGGLQGLIGSAAYHFGLAYYFGLGNLYYEWNDLESAEKHLLQGIELIRGTHTAEADMIVLAYARLAQLRQARGEDADALAALNELAYLEQKRKFLPSLVNRRAAEEARIRLAQNDLRAAVRWSETSGLSLKDQHLSFPREAEYLILTQVTLSRNREFPDGASLREAVSLLNRLFYAAETDNRMGSLIEILNLRALALYALGEFGEAREAIFRSLRLAMAEGFLRVFVDQGTAMRDLLLEISTRLEGATPQDEISRVLAGFPNQTAGSLRLSKFETPTQSPEQAERFTRRELEVLQLIAEGASNQEIAANLVIAGPTVKRHISHIFDKLGVGSRTQALAQARKLGLVT